MFTDISLALKCAAVLSEEALTYGTNYYNR
jgi:hypothetical protein